MANWQKLPRSIRKTTDAVELDVWAFCKAVGVVVWKYTVIDRATGRYLAAGEAATQSAAIEACEAA